jgi:hypothetical protein
VRTPGHRVVAGRTLKSLHEIYSGSVTLLAEQIGQLGVFAAMRRASSRISKWK